METIKIADLSTEKVIHRIPVCLETICIDDGDEKKLTCAKCKQKQHYYCTGLPTYQIRMFITKKYRSFVCINCIPVSEELQIIVSRQEEGIIGHLRRDVKVCESTVKSIKIKLSKTKSKSRKSNLQELSLNHCKMQNFQI